ncbi:hypothetical protein H310_03217 [Aphanomyces invadans]|uniref:Uncharacterized protein n=1 Tax=Aphanomyces invadans TaxID=157072 RepID=A0A024UGR3_9STRA|nr:hypothetical protein H310_03217 [Aphanomyces invadans]ETW05454.1 hypothetical protein H310_03217 [Aphanomyces invadans]|eukprot:XP_008865231.1 hypothetical protein H310_03217 [Aphanomyces invadans]
MRHVSGPFVEAPQQAADGVESAPSGLNARVDARPLFELPGTTTMNINAANPNARNDLEERVSYIQSATNDKDAGGYSDAKTPGELEDGALVAGGALNLFSKEAFALFAQYGAIGVIYGLIPSLNYPIFNVYLQLNDLWRENLLRSTTFQS